MFNLTTEQKQILESQHRAERDERICDRIQAVLLRSEDWEVSSIAQALRIHEDSVWRHLKDSIESEKLKPGNGGSEPKLDEAQSSELIAHLSEHLHHQVAEMCTHVNKYYDVSYTASGLIAWLHAHGFSYKQTKGVPSKAEPDKQAEFIQAYDTLKQDKKPEEPIYPMHFKMQDVVLESYQ